MNATAPIYDLILQGGHVICPASGIDADMDIAVADGKAQSTVARSVCHSDACEPSAANRPFDFELHTARDARDPPDEDDIRPLYSDARGSRRNTIASGGAGRG